METIPLFYVLFYIVRYIIETDSLIYAHRGKYKVTYKRKPIETCKKLIMRRYILLEKA